ncbi:MAG: DISARM system phospholipase D-like protein DrmC [Propionibacteriaceae bacterium]|jgi:phosphatidylserine/phosphatidylglycerophosphate/cardiolipin synthase-like enzyme|nr:DISARM system phospholipase D-like protein DrmC [Propionibacteriaceae bacterium]
MSPADPAYQLGEVLTGTEASRLADRLSVGATLSQAIHVVASQRRVTVRRLLADLTEDMGGNATVGFLRAIAGAHAHATSLTPIWTAPFNATEQGDVTSSVQHLVRSARESVVCSTYNFQRSSLLWTALAEVATQPEVTVRVYVDTAVADDDLQPWKPTTRQMARELSPVIVMRTRLLNNGQRVRNHAKFMVIDHRILLVTSANYSKSAETQNVEFGLQLDDPLIAQSVEAQMRALEDRFYERVSA